MKDAIRQAKDGVILDLEISPGAKETGVYGYNPWRRRIEIKLAERAEKASRPEGGHSRGKGMGSRSG